MGLGALPLKPPWRELRRVAMDCGAATNRSGGVERRETKAGARLLDIDEECLPLHCTARRCSAAARPPCSSSPPPLCNPRNQLAKLATGHSGPLASYGARFLPQPSPGR